MNEPIRYARSGDVNIAYQITGEGPFDLVLVPGFFSHLEIDWEHHEHALFLERLGSPGSSSRIAASTSSRGSRARAGSTRSRRRVTRAS
jgi:hypothetical protein